MAEVVRMNKRRKDETGIETIAQTIKKELGAELITYDVVDLGDGKKAVMLAFEQYFFRVSQYVSMNILLTDDGHLQTAIAVGSGGGSGLTNISWGANKSFVKQVEKILENLGFDSLV